MDAAGARMVNQGATKGASELDSSSARSRSSSTANPDKHEKDLQDDDDNTAASDDLEEEEDVEEQEEEEDSDEDDEEPRLKYAYLTKHLGSVYRNGDATSTFLVAGDKMVSPVIELWESVS
jgi:Ca2+-dependent lipid-binding protein